MIDFFLGRLRWIESRPLAVILALSLGLLALRVWLALPFWSSGLTKWVSFPTQLSSSAQFLFAQHFMLHLPGGPYPMPFPLVMAWAAGLAEIILPVLLVLGILTRISALGLLFMTLVIQLTIPDGWMIHAQWALAGLIVLALGPGILSADALIRRLLALRSPARASLGTPAA